MPAWRRHAVAPWRFVGTQLGVRHVARLERVIFRREVQIRRTGNQDRAGLNGFECVYEDTAVSVVGADVAVLPRPQFREQVVCVPVEMVAFPVGQ